MLLGLTWFKGLLFRLCTLLALLPLGRLRVTTRRTIVRSCPLLFVSLGYLDHGSPFTSLGRWGNLSVPINLARLTYLRLCERMALLIGVWGSRPLGH
jgi:hypothetical protein